MDFWSYRGWYGPPVDGGRADPGPADTLDRRLMMDVALAILQDPEVTDGRVDLRVQNGVAILDGEVPSAQARLAAVLTAASTPGIRDVCDMLRVVPHPPRR